MNKATSPSTHPEVSCTVSDSSESPPPWWSRVATPFGLFWVCLVGAGGCLVYLSQVNVHQKWFTASALYWVVTPLVLTASAAVRHIKKPYVTPRRIIEILLATAAIGAVFLIVNPAFRTLADETNLLSTSLGLFLKQELINVTQALNYYNQAHVVSYDVAHRPALFSVLTSMLHYLFGFRWYHGFVLNFLVGVASLLLFHRFATRLAGQTYGIICAVFLLCFPVFQLNITSSGFDALNMLFVALTYWQLYRFVLQPSAPRLEMLLLITVLTGQARYESLALVIPVGVIMLAHWHRIKTWSFSWYFPLLPLFLIPAVWQKLLSDSFANSGDTTVNAFDLSRVGDNVIHLAESFLDWNQVGFPTSPIIVVLSLTGFVLTVRQLICNRDRRMWWFFGAALTGFLTIAIIHLSYQYGDMRLAWINRLTQVHLVWMVPLGAYPVHRLLHRFSWRGLLPLVLVGLWIHGTSTAHRDPLGKTLVLQREFRGVRQFLQATYAPEETLIIADERSNMYVALGYSVRSTNDVNQHPHSLRENLAKGLYQTVLHIERRAFGPRSHSSQLDALFHKEERYRRQIRGNQSVVISLLRRDPPPHRED